MKDILSIDAQIDYLTEKIHARVERGRMTPLQRYGCLVSRQLPDRMPVDLTLDLEWGAHYLGYRIDKEFAWDPRKWAHAALACNDRLESDVCAPFLDMFVIGPDAMGAQVYYHEDSFPEIVEALVKNRADLAKLRVPDPHKDGRLPVLIEAVRICKEKVGDILPVHASINGPFSWAANLRGISDFLVDLKRDPQFVHALLEIVTEAVKQEIKAFTELGVRPFLGDATASTYLISPRHIQEFYLPYYAKLEAELGPGQFVGQVWADYATQARDFKLTCLRGRGIHNYCYSQSEEILPAEDILEAKRVARQVGSYATIYLWGKWVQVHSPKEIDAEVQRVIALTGPEWPFLVGMFSVPVPCPSENLDAFVRAIKKYGVFAPAQEKLTADAAA